MRVLVKEIKVHYGTSGASLSCPDRKCTWEKDLAYPTCTIGDIIEQATKHTKTHR